MNDINRVLARLMVPGPLGGGGMTNRLYAVEVFQAGVRDGKLVESWVAEPCDEAADLRGISTLMLERARSHR